MQKEKIHFQRVIIITSKENYLRAVRFERPDHIPMTFHINDACYNAYPQEALFELVETHPLLFPDFKKPRLPFQPKYSNVAQKNHPYKDDFGCVWTTTTDGITGSVTGHPLESWDDFESYIPPNPDICTGIGSVDWNEVKKSFADTPRELHIGGLRHGHTFLQLCDIRGYENLLFDMVDEEPRLLKLIDMVEEFNLGIVMHYIECGVDIMTYAEDLGMQVGPMLSPEYFRKYIKPSYERLIKPAKERGIPIHMHSDGDIRLLVDDIIDGGVEIINLQDLVNGIDWIKSKFSGKVCVDLDIDRQKITRFGTPKEIDELIRTEVSSIGTKDGGLTMIYGLYPDVSLENVKALMDAMERYMGYFG